MVTASVQDPIPEGAERRIGEFTELVATAIANADARAALTESRARIVAASDEARRRLERDLHDGVQQRIVSLALDLRAAQELVPEPASQLHEELSEIATGMTSTLDELRELSHGIHPAILSQGGLQAALKSLSRRSAVPIELDFHGGSRMPEPVEVAMYYAVSEAATNAAKHAQASVVLVEVATDGAVAELSIRDDGIGGADLGKGKGSGLVGLRDRVEALGGRIDVSSPVRGGTSLMISIPTATYDSADIEQPPNGAAH
jgi:signal transduction histidine kinase